MFKGAATTVIGRAEDGPLYRHYLSLLDGGTKPNLAKLTIARQIVSIMLALWRTGETYEPKRLEANRLQGRASIEILGWAWWPESPGIGYTPLERRTKRWAKESQIEGWFPLWSGERHGCEGLPDCDAEPMVRTSIPALRN